MFPLYFSVYMSMSASLYHYHLSLYLFGRLWVYFSLCCFLLIFHLTHPSFSSLSDQIRSVTQSCPTLCDPMNRSTPGLPVHHQLLEFTQTHVHWVSDAIHPSDPLSSLLKPSHCPKFFPVSWILFSTISSLSTWRKIGRATYTLFYIWQAVWPQPILKPLAFQIPPL